MQSELPSVLVLPSLRIKWWARRSSLSSLVPHTNWKQQHTLPKSHCTAQQLHRVSEVWSFCKSITSGWGKGLKSAGLAKGWQLIGRGQPNSMNFWQIFLVPIQLGRSCFNAQYSWPGLKMGQASFIYRKSLEFVPFYAKQLSNALITTSRSHNTCKAVFTPLQHQKNVQ